MLSFKPAFSLSSFTLIKMLFSSSSLSAIRVVSSVFIWDYWYFSQQPWFQLALHRAQHFTWCTYSACKLNKQDDNIQPWRTPFPIWNQLVSVTEKAMAPHSSTLAWKIPWAEEPGRLQSMGSLRVGHDWGISLSLFTFMHWRRKWQPTPVFLPGESQGRGSLEGCRLWGRTESDKTETT